MYKTDTYSNVLLLCRYYIGEMVVQAIYFAAGTIKHHLCCLNDKVYLMVK